MHTSAHGYVALVAKGRYEEAYRVASEPNPFPSVCGRICTHVCETECTRGNVEDPIAIAGIKRFVADHGAPAELPAPLPVVLRRAHRHRRRRPRRPHRRPRARAVRLQGDRVRGAARSPAACCASASPSTACRATSLQGEVDRITALGVELKTGRRCGTDFTVDSLFADGYKAVFLATGLHQSKDLPIDGLDQQGVVRAVEFLRAQALGESADHRQARRRGRRRRRGLRRRPHRLPLRRRRGHARLHRGRAHGAGLVRGGRGGQGGAGPRSSTRSSPVEILGRDGIATGVKFQRCTLGEPNERGWRPPVPVEGEFVELDGRHRHLRRRPGDRRRLRSPAPTASPSSAARSRSTPTR